MVDRMPSPRGDKNLRIELGRVRMPWEQVAKLGPGSVVSLETLVDEPVDIVVDSHVVARGEVLVLTLLLLMPRLKAPSLRLGRPSLRAVQWYRARRNISQVPLPALHTRSRA